MTDALTVAADAWVGDDDRHPPGPGVLVKLVESSGVLFGQQIKGPVAGERRAVDHVRVEPTVGIGRRAVQIRRPAAMIRSRVKPSARFHPPHPSGRAEVRRSDRVRCRLRAVQG